MDTQLREYLDRFELAPGFARWIERELRSLGDDDREFQRIRTAALAEKLAGIDRKLDNLTHLRLDERLDDAEFARLRDTLRLERVKVEQEQRAVENPDTTVELFSKAISFGKTVRKRFESGNPEEKRAVVRELLSNLFVESKKLRIVAKKQYGLLSDLQGNPSRRALRDALRILAESDFND